MANATFNSSALLGSIRHPKLPQQHIKSSRCRSQQPSSSPLTVTATLAEIQNSGVIACLRAKSAELATEAALAALRGGISVLEIVMPTPGVFEVLQELVGTVLNTIDAKNAIKAGAKFLMSPVMVKGILDDVQGEEVLYIPGVMTPTEVLNAHIAGAVIVKVYPISSLGGPQYISALKKPFPHIPMVASQGITVESLGSYIERGASAVVLSDAIFGKEAMDQQNFDAIQQLAQLAVSRGDEAVQRRKCRLLN